MKVLYLGLKHDYGQPERGLDYGYYNTLASLREMADETTLVDIGVAVRGMPRAAFNRKVRQAAAEARPDVVFCGLFREEVTPATLQHLRDELGLPVLVWFADDQWRFASHSARYAPHVSLAVTTATAALPKYEALGVKAVKSQWACNPFLYRPMAAPLEHDVSFVGQPHGDRRAVVDGLRAAGIQVDAYGQGWPNGRIGQEEMVRLFSASRINLNLANASTSPEQAGTLLGRVAGRLAGARLPKAVRTAGRRLLAQATRLGPAVPPLAQQVKGRNFEIPACGGFTLTSRAEGLEESYAVGKEVACYDDPADLPQQIRLYLGDEDMRRRVAEAGYRRTVREHTWFHRFEAIFRAMAIAAPSAASILKRGSQPSPLNEVFP
jgi:spore maturation protein CgeB